MSKSHTIESQCEAAMKLLSMMPPKRSQIDLRNLLLLRELANDNGGNASNDEMFINSILATADQQVKSLSCHHCPSHYPCGSHVFSPKTYRQFLPSEYNRDGNNYRCPWCNVYNSEKDLDSSTSYFPPKKLRKLEEIGMAMFAEYAQLYYGEQCVSSCYLWEEGSVEGAIGVAVLFSQRKRKSKQHQAEEDEEAGTGDMDQGVWSSTHVISVLPITEGSSEYRYTMNTTLYLNVDCTTLSSMQQNTSSNSSVRFSGFVSHASKTFTSSSKKLGAVVEGKPVPHLSLIGHNIQKVENRLRDVVSSVYFSKAGNSLSQTVQFQSAGTVHARGHRMLTAATEVKAEKKTAAPKAEAPIPSESVTTSETKSSKKEKKRKESESDAGHWEESVDEEGNTYYYHTVTMETAWERPETTASVEQAQPQEEAEEELTVPGILTSLSLSAGDPEEYTRILRKKLKVKTFLDLLVLQDCSDEEGNQGADYVLAPYITAYGDRRKIVKWIGKNQELREQYEQ